MDFEYHYTEEQERFRAEVSAWLEANLPQDLKEAGDWRELGRSRVGTGQGLSNEAGRPRMAGSQLTPLNGAGEVFPRTLLLALIEELGKEGDALGP